MNPMHKMTLTVVLDEGEREIVLTFNPAQVSNEKLLELALTLYQANEVAGTVAVEPADAG